MVGSNGGTVDRGGRRKLGQGFRLKGGDSFMDVGAMDLLEYQAKALFRSVGIPVLPSQQIEQARDLKNLRVPYPVVLKSQVYAGGRGRAGGVRFVANTIDGIAAAQAIFNLPIAGEYPQVLLAEAKYDANQEFYLAVMLNPVHQRVVLLGSTQGGIGVQSALDQIHQVVIETEFSAFQARQLAMAMGLGGDLLNRVSEVVERMYALLIQKDLDLVEINPLGVRGETEVMALDGKVTVNDRALTRHPDLLAWWQTNRTAIDVTQPQLQTSLEPDGTLGIVVNGSGLLMATVDQVYAAGGRPYCYINIGGETQVELSLSQFHDRLLDGLGQLAAQPAVQQILVNLISGIVPGEVIFDVLAAFDAELLRRQALPQAERVVALAARSQNKPLELWLCGAGMTFPRSRSRFKRLTVTVYDHLTVALDNLIKT
jgi:succinyl-CoA synthetase beta subunit